MFHELYQEAVFVIDWYFLIIQIRKLPGADTLTYAPTGSSNYLLIAISPLLILVFRR